MADVLSPTVLWVLLVGDAVAKLNVNECSRCIDSWRSERRFSGVRSIRIFRTSLIMTVLVSMPRLVWVAWFVLKVRSSDFQGSHFSLAAMQLTISIGVLLSAVLLAFATTPPYLEHASTSASGADVPRSLLQTHPLEITLT